MVGEGLLAALVGYFEWLARGLVMPLQVVVDYWPWRFVVPVVCFGSDGRVRVDFHDVPVGDLDVVVWTKW